MHIFRFLIRNSTFLYKMVHVFWGPDTSWSTVVPRSRRPELPQEGDAWFPSSEEKTIGISVVLWPRIAWASGHIEPYKTKRVSKSECPGQKNLGLKKEMAEQVHSRLIVAVPVLPVFLINHPIDYLLFQYNCSISFTPSP